MNTRIRLVLASILVPLLFVCSFSSSSASAIDLVQEVVYKSSGSGQLYHNSIFNNTSYNTGWINSSYTFPANINLNSIAFRTANNTNFTMENGWFLTTTMYVNFPGTNNQWNSTGLFSVSNNEVSCPIIDIDDTMVETHTSGTATSQRYTVFITCKLTGSLPARMNLFIKTNSDTAYNITYNAVGYTVWQKASNYDYTDDITAVKNAVNSMKTSIENKLDTTNNKLEAVKSALNDLKGLQQQANQDAQDRYDQEKQEESDREDAMEGQSSNAQSVFNFNVLNPFSGLFNLFANDCTGNIPIIASWLHAPSSTYTSWWCPTDSTYGVRSTLTPVFGIASMMLLFGFVVRWLSHNSGDIYGARNMNKEFNG